VLAAGDEVVALTAPDSEGQLRTLVVGDGYGGPHPGEALDGAGSL
jgi:hypothetical protein